MFATVSCQAAMEPWLRNHIEVSCSGMSVAAPVACQRHGKQGKRMCPAVSVSCAHLELRQQYHRSCHVLQLTSSSVCPNHSTVGIVRKFTTSTAAEHLSASRSVTTHATHITEASSLEPGETHTEPPDSSAQHVPSHLAVDQHQAIAPQDHTSTTMLVSTATMRSSSEDSFPCQPEDEEELFPEMQLNLPTPTHTKVKTAVYLQSCVKVEDCPIPKYPEFAVIGRSNVGKSSLINMLTGSKGLALVSKEPGKTKCINHFLINDSWYLVDLPGYGYARLGQGQRDQFEDFTKAYFKTRPNLAMVFLLVDGSIPPQKIDLEYSNWLTDNEVPFTLVFTKVEKRKKGSGPVESNVTAFKRELLKDLAYLPPSILTSSLKGIGKVEMQHFIASLRVAVEQSGILKKYSKPPRRPRPAPV